MITPPHLNSSLIIILLLKKSQEIMFYLVFLLLFTIGCEYVDNFFNMFVKNLLIKLITFGLIDT